MIIEKLLCKSCGETIAQKDDLKHFSSLHSLKEWKQTLLGVRNVRVQLFENPQGAKFKVVTFADCNVYSFEEVKSLHCY